MSYTVTIKPITPHEIIDFQAAKIHKKITPKQKNYIIFFHRRFQR